MSDTHPITLEFQASLLHIMMVGESAGVVIIVVVTCGVVAQCYGIRGV